MAVKVDFDMTDNSNEVLEGFGDAIIRALIRMGMRAERHAKEYVPVVSGRLRNSITFATISMQSAANTSGGEPAKPKDYKMHGTPSKDSIVLGTNVEYAYGIETGGSRKAPSGFLRPAIVNHIDEYKKIVASTLKGEGDT